MITLRNKRIQPTNSLLDPFFFGNNYAPAVKSVEQKSRIYHNILKEENQFSIEIAAPGFEKKNFGIEVVENSLIITLNTPKVDGSSIEKNETPSTAKFLRKEFNFSDFKKTFSLPSDTDKENITANYEMGILRVTIPIKEKITRKVSIK